MKSSAFEKKFMTVTPFSHLLALGLFILMPFIGFFVGLNYAKTQPETAEEHVEGPEMATQDFYGLYINCLNIQSQNGKPCEWKNSSYADKSLAENVAKKKINLTCSQNVPLGVISKLIKADSKEATVDTYQVYEKDVVKVRAFLKNIDGVWKVSDIECQPDSTNSAK